MGWLGFKFLPPRPVLLASELAKSNRELLAARVSVVRVATAAGFRLRLGGGVALRLRSAIRSSPLFPTLAYSPRSPTRRPKPNIRSLTVRQIGKSKWHTHSRHEWRRDKTQFDCMAHRSREEQEVNGGGRTPIEAAANVDLWLLDSYLLF
jgi:hypothetical protein